MRDKGMPVGLTFAGRAYDDSLLLCLVMSPWPSRVEFWPGMEPGTPM